MTATCAPVEGGTNTYTLLQDVRVGTHAGYDRIVLEFAPTFASPSDGGDDVVPTYELRQVDALFEDGSGEPVEVAGAQLYSIVFHGASGVDLTTNTPVPSYTGPEEFTPDFPSLTELEQTGDFEATLSWGFGLDQPHCPTTNVLKNPTRLVIDIPH